MKYFKRFLPLLFFIVNSAPSFTTDLNSFEFFDKLPRGPQIQILAATKPTIQNLWKYELVCKHWRDIASDNSLWIKETNKYFKYESIVYTEWSTTACLIFQDNYDLKSILIPYKNYPRFKMMAKYKKVIAEELSLKCESYLRHIRDRFETIMPFLSCGNRDKELPPEQEEKFRSFLASAKIATEIELAGVTVIMSEHIKNLTKKIVVNRGFKSRPLNSNIQEWNIVKPILDTYIMYGSKLAADKLKKHRN